MLFFDLSIKFFLSPGSISSAGSPAWNHKIGEKRAIFYYCNVLGFHDARFWRRHIRDPDWCRGRIRSHAAVALDLSPGIP